MTTFHTDTICIVGYGCVLPEANNPEAFWRNLHAGRCSIRPIEDSRWDKGSYLVTQKGTADRTYSDFAGHVDDAQIAEIARTLGIAVEDYTRLQLTTLMAGTQALANIKNKKDFTFGITLGCMGSDEAISVQKFLNEEASLREFIQSQPKAEQKRLNSLLDETVSALKKSPALASKTRLASSAPELLKQFHDLTGPVALIDAACASSHAALDMAMQQLQSKEVDLALSGGIEGQLAPENFVLFASLGLLAQTVPHPLDASADGMAQGEGAVVFCLERLEDALRNEHPIYGVLRSCEGTSNGKATSLFSPTVEGQTRAIRSARAALGDKKLCYIECHGTGTRVGDTTELRTLNSLLPDASAKTPVGSVKALIGHTKGTAGAAGVLKCLLSLKARTLPPSPYFKEFIEKGSIDKIFVNTSPIPLGAAETLAYGISSAGFGGANYHLILEEFVQGGNPIPRLRPKKESLVVLAHAEIGDENIRESIQQFDFRIPPKNLKQIDKLQLQALVAVTRALEEAAIPMQSLNRERISVISASALGIEAAYNLSKRIRHAEFYRFSKDEKLASLLESHKEKFAAVTEDTGPGTLNNVIAGRVCNVFDVTGKNFNVDADTNSLGMALIAANLELQSRRSEMLLLLYAEEHYDESIPEFERRGVTCLLLALESTARRQNRNIQYLLKNLHYSDQCLRQA
ncbi:MAG: beta-ketoacyl synthase N-terminal-like domain-containing protein [Bdellovibrionota bacterium]